MNITIVGTAVGAKQIVRVLRNVLPALCLVAGLSHAQNVIKIGIGTQNTTTNTVTGGIVIKELKLLEKYLPKTGKYAGVKYEFDWQNATSGPPITNGLMADKIHIGMMGDYPLLVAGATGQATKNETQLIALIAYNQFGAGNGVVVHKDSPYYELSDLKGKLVSVPFGSAGTGLAGELLEPGEPVARGRHHQSAGKTHRRSWRFCTLRGTAAVPWLCAQDF